MSTLDHAITHDTRLEHRIIGACCKEDSYAGLSYGETVWKDVPVVRVSGPNRAIARSQVASAPGPLHHSGRGFSPDWGDKPVANWRQPLDPCTTQGMV